MWYAVAIFFIALGVREVNKRAQKNPGYKPMVALLGAAIFVISVWHIPVPVTGSCSHPVGTPMASIIIGPFVAVMISSIALFFHIFLAHGGLTTIGANTVSMGIAGAFSGYITFKFLGKVGIRPEFSAGIAAFVGDLLTYVTTALQLALSLHPQAVLKHWSIFVLGFIPTQIPLAVFESIFTFAAIKYLLEHSQEVGLWTASQKMPSLS